MHLPTNATVDDIDAICNYLLDKPTGASAFRAKSVFAKGTSGDRKLAACRLWGFIEKGHDGRIVITERGRAAVRNKGARQAQSCREAIADFPAYIAVIEGAVKQGKFTVLADEISSYWQEHFPSEVSKSGPNRNLQVACFLRLLKGAGLGEMTVGNRVQKTRFDFNADQLHEFVKEGENDHADTQGKSPKEPKSDHATETVGHRGMEEGEQDQMEVQQEQLLPLPSHATRADIESICAYLADKPAGATAPEVSSELGENARTSQKPGTCSRLGFIQLDDEGRMRISERGRRVLSDVEKYKAQSYLEAISGFPAYEAIIEVAVNQRKRTLAASEVASLWHERFRSEASGTEQGRIDQAVCLFHLLEGAGLGVLTVGRPGRVTRFDFNPIEPGGIVKESEEDFAEMHGEGPEEPEAAGAPEEAILREEVFEAHGQSVPTEEKKPSLYDERAGEGVEDHPGRPEVVETGDQRDIDASDGSLQPLLAKFESFRVEFEKMQMDNANARADNAETVRTMNKEIADLRVEMADLRATKLRHHRHLLALAAVAVAVLGGLQLLLGL